MSSRASSYEEIRGFLYREPTRNATIISGIERSLPRLDDIWVSRAQDGTVTGVIALAAAPDGTRSAVLAGAPNAVGELLGSLPAGEEFLFHLPRPELIPALRDRLDARHQSTVRCYRC